MHSYCGVFIYVYLCSDFGDSELSLMLRFVSYFCQQRIPETHTDIHRHTHTYTHIHTHIHTNINTRIHTRTHGDKMADEANSQLDSALNTLLSITEKSGNLRKDLKRDILDSVSTLRNTFVNLINSVEEQMAKIGLLESKVKKAKAELQGRIAADLSARYPPSRDGTGKTPATGVRHVLPTAGRAKEIYAEVARDSIEKDTRSCCSPSPINRQRQ